MNMEWTPPGPEQMAEEAMDYAARQKVMGSPEVKKMTADTKQEMARGMAGMKGDNTSGGVQGLGETIKIPMSAGSKQSKKK